MEKERAYHGLYAIEKTMRPEHRVFLPLLTDEERASLEENVTQEIMSRIETWIGNSEDIERLLYWDRGGKFEDPKWKKLEPVDKDTGRLFRKADDRLRKWKAKSVESQLRSDLTLHSQFNEGLLFTGLAGAIRCDKKGNEDKVHGEFFRGIELRCIGSVEEEINFVRIVPKSKDAFEVSLGSYPSGKTPGMLVYSGDSYALLQLEKLVNRDFTSAGWLATLLDPSGKLVTLDPKAIRKAARKNASMPCGDELVLQAFTQTDDADESIDRAAEGVHFFYDRFGLETECFKIGRRYGNFHIVRNDNFDRFLGEGGLSAHRGLVLFTATLTCRRCRREIPSFRNLAREFPGIEFGLVNLASPQFKFYERVFADMGGGDANKFRHNAEGSTPFTIIYAPNSSGRLEFKEYFGTDKADAPPSEKKVQDILKRYFL